MKKKTRKTLLGFLIVVLIIAAVFLISRPQSVFGEDIIWKVEYGNLACLEDGDHTDIQKWVDQGYEFTCGDKVLVDECRIYITCTSTGLIPCKGSYYIDDSGRIGYQSSYSPSKSLLTTLAPGETIRFDSRDGIFGSWKTSETIINYQFNPYRLWVDESGKQFLASSNDCCLANQADLNKKNIKYGEWDCLTKDERRNYFLDWVAVGGFKIYNYENQKVICTTNQLYSLDEEKLADGSTRYIQSNPIKYVECCPQIDNNCGDDFKFKQEPQERECDYDYQCDNSGDPRFISKNVAQVEECIDNECVSRTFDTECSSDDDCIVKYGSENWVCSKVFNTFGECIEGKIVEPYCGDGTCNLDETYENCPKDCEPGQLTCEWWQTYKPEKIKSSWFGIKKTTIPARCATAAWVWIVGIVLIISGLVAIFALSKKKKKRK